jgi:hypothetical protein
MSMGGTGLTSWSMATTAGLGVSAHKHWHFRRMVASGRS